MNKKFNLVLLLGLLLAVSFVSAYTCKGYDGYYHDCGYAYGERSFRNGPYYDYSYNDYNHDYKSGYYYNYDRDYGYKYVSQDYKKKDPYYKQRVYHKPNIQRTYKTEYVRDSSVYERTTEHSYDSYYGSRSGNSYESKRVDIDRSNRIYLGGKGHDDYGRGYGNVLYLDSGKKKHYYYGDNIVKDYKYWGW